MKEKPSELAEQLHKWYLKITKRLNTKSFNSEAQKGYFELTDEQRAIDIFIAERILENFISKEQHEKEMKTEAILWDKKALKRYEENKELKRINRMGANKILRLIHLRDKFYEENQKLKKELNKFKKYKVDCIKLAKELREASYELKRVFHL